VNDHFSATEEGDASDEDEVLVGEAEIMIAEASARGHGLGLEAMGLMLHYGLTRLDVRVFEAKIKTDNEVSLRMFRKLGFSEVGRSAVFDEVTLRAAADDDFRTTVAKVADGVVEGRYDHEEEQVGSNRTSKEL
jgi:hypothetical protein